ncbi:hypothetical protein FDA94_29065 [Herbidospora galbida]|uniref:Protein RecA n=1 Tax=Herbidospora galbida TaxID=2575442 RepID=A0A4U3MAG4_9ACTN|nr:hypothetical protein [Herbidospora galbida]TKK84667.1 hypothetical protein FDA94_29065 [Herbidospora galbida]
MNTDALALVAKVNKGLGRDALITASALSNSDRITSGSLAIDVALGGGWPVNQWIEIIGRESNGKTTVVYKTVAANQQRDPEFTTLWVAAEHYDWEYATALGVDNTRVIVLNTQEMEMAYDTILEFAGSRSVDCIVLDSYPALTPSEEADKSIGESVVAIGARLTGKFFRKVGAHMTRAMDGSERPVTCFFINQWRDQIGGFSPRGIPQITPGGKAKNYAFYVRVEVTRDEFIDEPRPGKGKTRVGQVIKVKTVKNKSAPPQRVATTDYYFADAPYLGFQQGDYDLAKEYMIYAIHFDIIRRGGSIYSYGDRKWKGKEELLASLREEVDLQEELRERILAEASRPDSERLRDAA